MDVTTPPLPTLGPAVPAAVVVFGGTFDPPHVGHVRLPVLVREEMERRLSIEGRAWLLYVPAARSPHKEHGPVASDDERAEMLRLAISETPRTAVWTDEMDRAARRSNIVGQEEGVAGKLDNSPNASPLLERGDIQGPLSERGGTQGAKSEPSYTVDTLTRLREWLDENGLSGVPTFLLIGADQAVTFHYWRRPRDILRLVKPLVMIRGEARNADALADRIGGLGYWNRAEMETWRAAIVPVGRIDVSATQVRAALAAGADEEAAKVLAPVVLEYIRMRGLYHRTPGNYP